MTTQPNNSDPDVASMELRVPLTPAARAEDEEARKSRINSELVQLLQTPSLPGRTASVQGFGVYTHARIKRLDEHGEPQNTSAIMYLPVGGPNKVRKGKPESQAPIDEKVQKAWKTVEEAVEEEEGHLHERNFDIEKLKERYGALEAPESPATAKPDAQLQQRRMQQWIEYLSRRASNAGQMSSDVAMGGTDQENIGSNVSVSNQSPIAPLRGNVYHQERDPRKR
jgi:hypothetical protein